MTKKERVSAAIEHRPVDRVPRGEICISGGFANALLQKDYPLSYQHFERDCEARGRLGMDLANIGDWPETELPWDVPGEKRFRSTYGYEFISNGVSKRILRPAVEDIECAGAYRAPDIREVSTALLERYARETDFFLFAQVGGPISMVDEMFPMEDYMMYCLTNTKEIQSIGETVAEYEVQKACRFLDAGADAILVTDDIAFNTGTFLPPAVMEAIAYPVYRQMVSEIRRKKKVPVFFHSDGDLNKVMENILSCGFDGLHSLQPSAGMDIRTLKRDYGDQLCLMGNIDLDYVMTFAPPDEVRRVVRETVEAASPGSGYILATCNTMVDSIPPENALAMYEFDAE